MDAKRRLRIVAAPAMASVLAARTGFAHHQGSWTHGPPEGAPDPGATRAATAQGVALGRIAGCNTNANLDITLTTTGATREFGLVTRVDGTVLFHFEQATNLMNFSGTFVGYGLPILPSQPQPANTLIGTYAYVGETPPDHSNTAEFFILFSCTTREVLVSCFGPFGTCPQMAREAIMVPAAPTAALLALALLLAAAGALAVRRRARR